MAEAGNVHRKRIKNSATFRFNEEDVLPPIQKPSSKSVQSRLCRKVATINNNEVCSNSGSDSQSHSYSKLNMGIGNLNARMGNLKIQNSKPVLPQKEKIIRAKASSTRGSDDGLLDDIVARLKAEYENSCCGSSKSQEGSVQGVSVDRTKEPNLSNEVKTVSGRVNNVGCICERSMKLVMCSLCGLTKPGRVSFQCQYHPRAIFLSDLKECPSCKIGGIAKLKEFDLPTGMKSIFENVGKK